VFEVFWQGWPGLACAGANQQEMTTCTNSGRQGKKKIFKKKWTD
jgi:hypothetical protein